LLVTVSLKFDRRQHCWVSPHHSPS